MDNEKDGAEEKIPSPLGGDQRIQFIPTVKPERARPDKDDGPTFIPPSRRSQSVGSVSRRPQSIVSIPPVASKQQKDRKKREKDAEEKQVDVTEHLIPHQQVAEKYTTRINLAKPGESIGLTSSQAQQLLAKHGPNVLTPPPKRHWLLKFWDCLSSLFNLLLILAGCLEYILLGIDFKNNFQNVRIYKLYIED